VSPSTTARRLIGKAARKSEPDPHPPLTDLQCACASARQVARVLTQLYDHQLRQSGLEAPQFGLLMTLDQQGPCSQADLGRRYALDKTTVSRNLKVLERRKWIEASVGDDRRERQFRLTVAGRSRLAQAKPEWRKAQTQLQSGMTAEQWRAMFTVFRTVTHAAQTVQAQKPPARQMPVRQMPVQKPPAQSNRKRRSS
jgi:DNA-binding MarR family transcriptional regulator